MYTKLSNNLKLLIRDPITFFRKLRSFILPPKSKVIAIGGKVNFYVDTQLSHPAIKGMYFGIYEPHLLKILKKLLKNGDTFIDVGANIGYISAHALALVGTEGHVHAFEPVPKYFKYLEDLKARNPLYSIYLNNIALGATQTTSIIAIHDDNFGWNTMVPDFMSSGLKEKVEVTVITLSNYLLGLTSEERLSLKLIKIDVEGYEFEVLKGLKAFFETFSNSKPVIVVEINTSAYPKLGYTPLEVQELMEYFGYSCKSLDMKQDINLTKLSSTTDVCFIPNLNISRT